MLIFLWKILCFTFPNIQKIRGEKTTVNKAVYNEKEHHKQIHGFFHKTKQFP